jgi:hypothetical protein
LRGHSLRKILPLVVAISLLTGGLAPANPRCTAECCVQSTIAGSHSTVKTQPADLVADCCTPLNTTPCPRKLESTTESKDYAPAAVAPTVSPAAVKISAIWNNKFFLPQSRLLLAVRRTPQIRGSGVPIYLITETFLI